MSQRANTISFAQSTEWATHFPYCAHRQTDGKELHYPVYRLKINTWNYESNGEVPANLIHPFAVNHNGPGGSKLRGNGNGDLLRGTEKRIFAIRMINSVTTGDSVQQYSYNESQRDALFHKFISVKNAICFEQNYCPSSGVSTLYTQQLVFFMLVVLTASEVRMELVW